MGGQPIQFLAHVGLGRQGGGLQEDAVVEAGRVRREFLDAAGEAVADRLDLLAGFLFRCADQAFDAADEVEQHRLKLCAFAIARHP